jgi:glycosyltransferase involved in cell wall biosynthesis
MKKTFISGKRVLIIGPDVKTSRGGIASVIKCYNETILWKKYQIGILDPYCNRSNLIKIFRFFKAIALFILKINKYDVLHLHCGGQTSLSRKCFFLFFGNLFGKKTILHIHNTRTIQYLGGATNIIIKLLLVALRRADSIIVLSKSMKKSIEALNIGPNVFVLNNPCKYISGETVDDKKNEPTILFVGAITEKKGCYDLIRAFKQLITIRPGIRLVIAGDGGIEELSNYVSEENIEDHVEILGWVDDERIAEEYKKAYLLCLPSYQEGMPMVLIEAMAHGLPVITTPVGVIIDFITDGENGIIVPVGNIEMLCDAFLTIMEDEKLRNRRGKSGKEFVIRNFSIDKIVNELDTIYSKI